MKLNAYKNELILFVVSVLMCILFFNNHCNLTTDFGREILIPVEILNGKVLYKDILNIYPPLSYYLNALAVLIMGKNLNTFFIMGSLNCIIFTFVFYKLSLKFLNKTISLLTTLFVVFSCMYGFGLYNYQHPYSYGISYGLTAYLISVLFFVNYINKQEQKKLFISALFAGISVCCKIEFFPILFLNTLIPLLYKKISFKTAIKYCLISTIPFISYLIPLIQGITAEDMLHVFKITANEMAAPSVKYFYKLSGTYFSLSQFLSAVLNTLVAFIIFGLLYLLNLKFYNKKMILLLFAFPLFAAGLLLFNGKEFGILPLILLVTLIVLTIKNKNKFEINYLIFAGLGAAIKTVYSTDITLYGTYTLPLMFLSLIVLININNDLTREKFIKFAIIFLIGIKIIPIAVLYSEYNYEIKTEKGNIKTSKEWAKTASEYLNFVKENTNINDRILHLQEGALFNFLADRKTDMNIYALNAPYIETYGQEKIIDKLSEFDYITIIDGMGSYYFGNRNFYFEKNEITDYIKNNFRLIFVSGEKSDKIMFFKRIT